MPAHWPTEVSNGLLVALRKGRIQSGRPEMFWDELAILPIFVNPPLSPLQAKNALALAEKYSLTVYNSAYLSCATEQNLPFATLDIELSAAAKQEGIELL